jgi:hypothetical protein
MRIYVVVTSMYPLEAFIYKVIYFILTYLFIIYKNTNFNIKKEGFARLSTERFSLDPEDLDKLFIHLTNVAI